MNTATYNKDFHRTVKKAEIPTCNILGVDIAVHHGGNQRRQHLLHCH